MIRRPPRSTPLYSSAASDVYKRQPSYGPESMRGRLEPAWELRDWSWSASDSFGLGTSAATRGASAYLRPHRDNRARSENCGPRAVPAAPGLEEVMVRNRTGAVAAPVAHRPFKCGQLPESLSSLAYFSDFSCVDVAHTTQSHDAGSSFAASHAALMRSTSFSFPSSERAA